MQTRPIALLLALFTAFGPASLAAASDRPPARRPQQTAERRPGESVDARTGRIFNEAIELMSAERHAEARSKLGTVQQERLSPYERGRLELLYVNVDLAEERYASAREHLRAALASGGLNDVEISESRFRIGQIYAAEERWEDCARELTGWLDTAVSSNSDAFYTLAVCHYRAGALDASVEAAQRCVDLTDTPKETWLQLLVALRIERAEYALARPLLRRLVGVAPGRRVYWLQLSQVSAALDDPAAAAGALQLAYQANLLTEDTELRRLAESLAQVGIPYRAARILAREIERERVPANARSLELLANLWIAARENDRAVEPLLQAARLAGSGRLHLRLAEVHVQKQEWSAAEAAARAAREKGQLPDPCRAELLLGIAAQAQQRPGEARGALRRAGVAESCRREAEGWLRYIDSQLDATPVEDAGPAGR